MKKIILLCSILMNVSIFAEARDVLGTWITEKAENGNQIIVDIYETPEGKYNGKITELTIPIYTEGEYEGQEKMDLYNQDEKLRNRKLKGIDFISGFEYNSKDKKFENGEIYVPTTGKTYYSYMMLQDDGTLLVKGSIDRAGLFGKKQTWTRYVD